MRRAAAVAWLLAVSVVAASDPALVERIPKGTTPDAGDRAVVEKLSTQVYELEVEYDTGGRVVKLFATNHTVNQKTRKIADDRPGLGDGDAADLAKLAKLTAICLEKQAITEKGLAALKDLPLTDVRLHYMPKAIDPKFPAFLNGKPLEVLHLKHNFSAKVDMTVLKGFPDVRYLVLDTTAAGPGCVALVKGCPKVEVFELHRPKLTAAQFGELCDHLPNCRWFEVKPDIGGAAALKHLAKLPKLEALMLSQWKAGTLPYADGLEHLAAVKGLKAVSLSGAAAEDVAKLKAAAPHLKVSGADSPFPEHQTADGTRYNRISPIRLK